MRICILEADRPGDPLEPRFGTYADMFERWLGPALPEATFEHRHVAGGDPLPEPGDFDGYLVTGSRHGVYEALPWMAPLAAFLRSAAAAQVPVGGICFGHQILAAAHGGRVEKSAGGWVIGRHDHRIGDRTGDGLFPGMTALSVLSIHQDQVTAPPPGARVVLSTSQSPHSGLQYPFPALSVQFHPEFPPEVLTLLMEPSYGLPMTDSVAEAARMTLDGPLDNHLVAEGFARFFRAHAGATRQAGAHGSTPAATAAVE